jgi:hypothetical protein
VDAVIVLGDLAGTRVRKPWVVSWPAATRPVALGLERTVQAAVRAETKSDPGGSRALAQWMRHALGVTVSEQGAIGAEGLPALLISESGERGPAPGEPVRESRLQAFGRATLRAVSALDVAGPRDGPPFGAAPRGIVTMRNVLPDWAVRLLVGSLLLPALLAALDAFFRARRRRVAVVPAVGRLAVAGVPVLVAWLALRLLGLAGLLAAADGPVLPDAFPRGAGALVAVVAAALVAALAWYLFRRVTRPAPPEGHAVATGLAICALAAVVWVPNPYAAALLVPAAHLWLFAAGGWSARAAAAAVLAGLALPLAAVGYLALALDLAPLDLAWAVVLAVAGGHGLWTALVLAVLLAAVAGLMRVVLARRRTARAEPGAPIKTRGPLSYAGPGSLGGTESALRR